MLRNFNALTGFNLLATDGEIGRCVDFLFDDRGGAVRYMVASTARWLPGRKVVIAPALLETPDWTRELFPVRLTREQVEQSPPLGEHEPVSRQFEIRFHEFFSLPFYWVGPGPWDRDPGESGAVEPVTKPAESQLEAPPDEGHLRSAQEIVGYRIEASDGDIGRVQDLLVDDSDWEIRYLVIDTGSWLTGRKVLLSIERLSGVQWVDRSIAVDLPREAIENSPEYDPSKPWSGPRETDVFLYFEHPRGPGGAHAGGADKLRRD